VAHEIRTPLSSIVGFAQLLRDSSDLNDDERNEMLELLVQQSADITNIVDDLLVVAKTNLGRLEISSVPVDLRAQAAQAVESLDVGSTRVIELPSATVRCVGDPSRVRQIVRNLVSNAFKYGGGEIWVETQTRGDVGVLRVCDNGDGIPENYRKSVFDAYDRGGQTSGSTPSLGLGLHISLNLAHRMGGDLTYAYENASSVFELTLPLASARSEDLVPGPRPS
jgi:signal transduction histidine kinase